MVLCCAIIYLVRLIRDVVNGVRTVDTHAALDAAADLLAQHAGHILLSVQIFLVLMNVVKTINPLASQVRDGRAQFLVFRFGRLVIRCADGIDAIHLQLVRPVDQLAIVINVSLHFG